MLFSRDIYRVGARYPFVYGRQEIGGTAANPTKDWSLYFTGLFANSTDIANLPRISPWHAIMTRVNKQEHLYNYINEVPLGAKDAAATTGLAIGVECNPFKRNISASSAKATTIAPIPFNYGALPRTFCDPTSNDSIFAAEAKKSKMKDVSSSSRYVGDATTLDVIELGESPMAVGMVSQLRVLGAMATIRGGEKKNASKVVDWKIIATNEADPVIKTIADIPTAKLDDIRHWLIKNDAASKFNGDGSSVASTLAFGGKVLDEATAYAVIEAKRASYDALRMGKLGGKGKIGNVWIPEAKHNPANL